MEREIDMKEVSDGRFYSLRDMVRADCGGCQGCSDCCRGMGSSIVLDPYDAFRLTTGLHRSFEDFLDEFQEQKEGQENAKNRENAWIALVCTCRRQLELIEKQILKDTSLTKEKRGAWESQFALMDRECQKQMKLCGLEEFGAVGEEADYRLYDILSTAESKTTDDFGTVAEVYARGHIYQGTVIEKAQACAYKERNLST